MPSASFHSRLPDENVFLACALAGASADNRLYALEMPLDHSLLVEAWVGREQLSELYEWQLFCLGTDVHLELKDLIGQQVRLHTRLADGGRTTRSGWVAAVAQLGADGGFVRYRLSVVPWLWMATRRRCSRAFQDKSVTAILEQVFAADGARAHWRLAPGTSDFLARVRPRSYCCQFRETDYAFVSRLLAEEGIGFYFEEAPEEAHSSSDHCLVLFADSTGFAEDPQAAAWGSVRFHRDAAVEQRDGVQAFGSVRRLQAAVTAISTWDYKRKRVVAASVPTTHHYGGPEAARLEDCDWAGIYAFANHDEARHYAGILRDAADARFKTWFGRGSVRSFRAGSAFTLSESPLDQLPGIDAQPQRRRFSLLGILHAGANNLPAELGERIAQRLGTLDPAVLGSEHASFDVPLSVDDGDESDVAELSAAPARSARSARVGGGDALRRDEDEADTLDPAAWTQMLRDAAETGYVNRFTAIRSDICWRPALFDDTGVHPNPRPTALGSQTAIVVGSDGTAAAAGTVHTDHLGRIRIRYHWQCGEQATCWVRVVQMFAGPGYGAQFIPRIGQEVLVSFFDNDIDRPLVTGVLYNGRGQQDDAVLAGAGNHRPAGQDNTSGGASPAWHGAAGHHRHAGFLSGFKSVALGTDGYARQSNELVFDDSTGRLRTRVATDSAATQLNLGHLVHQADNYRGSFRGSGWELRSDAYGAVRAGKGLLISTFHRTAAGKRPEPAGENGPGIALLKQVRGLADSFNRAAAIHQTVQFILVKGGTHNGKASQSAIDEKSAPIDAMLNAISGMVDARDGGATGQGTRIPQMHAPLIVVTARAGIDVAAVDAVQLAAGEALHLASGRDACIAAGGELSVHAGQAIGLLAGASGAGEDGSGIKLYAGQGDLQLQAQSNEIHLAAQDFLQLISASSHVDLAAAKSVELCTEGGASLIIEGGNISFACPGTISIKAASKSFAGPSRLQYSLLAMPRGEMTIKKKFNFSG